MTCPSLGSGCQPTWAFAPPPVKSQKVRVGASEGGRALGVVTDQRVLPGLSTE